MKPLLVLDLDETLIHTTNDPGAVRRRHGVEPDFNLSFLKERIHLSSFKRPYLDDFLRSVQESWQLAVWTAASADYAEMACKEVFAPVGGLDALAFLWSYKRCTPYRYTRDESYSGGGEIFNIKRVKKIKNAGYDINRTLIVEDVPMNVMRSYGNLVTVDPFDGCPKDDTLYLLKRYLDVLKDAENFRKIEKRGWKAILRNRG